MTASSQPNAKTQDWQKRYLDGLDKLERERQHFGALESVLKRLISRLGSASQGQSKLLDEQIRALHAALRRETPVEELEKISSALADAIVKMDGRAGEPQAPPTATPDPALIAGPNVDASLRGTLSALLTQLRDDPSLAIVAHELDSKLSSSLPPDQLPELMSSIAVLVTQRIEDIERSKHEIELLLRQMVSRLDEISRFVSDQGREHSRSVVSTETLNSQLVGDMKAIGESVESAVDLQQIREQVRARLDSIGSNLKEFRDREAARISEMRARNEEMQSRVVQLEAQASKLQHQLSVEQRQSTIDGLTNIPNRLAYDNRIEEELHRWHRFKQPTCIAVWDIDRFKDINDRHGHRAGDRVLRAVADSLASRLRVTDFLARFGGEEFVMILRGSDIRAAVPVIERMRIAVSELKFHTHGAPLPPVTISIGLTEIQSGDSAEVAFDRADKVLYQAKNAGRNRCVSG